MLNIHVQVLVSFSIIFLLMLLLRDQSQREVRVFVQGQAEARNFKVTREAELRLEWWILASYVLISAVTWVLGRYL